MTADMTRERFLASVPWARARSEIAATAARPPHPYPWTGLEREVAARDDSSIHVVGYGSLMNRGSALRTLSDPEDILGPVVAFRSRRVFDYRMPTTTLARYPQKVDPSRTAALNVYQAEADEQIVTGVLCRVAFETLEAFRRREAGYDLIPVVTLPYLDLEGPLATAFILSCPATSTDGVRRTDHSLSPHPGYFQLCLSGARAVSDEFAELFLATTFRANGTLLSHGYDDLLD
jgi:hypothetical protein